MGLSFRDLALRQKLTWVNTLASGLALLLACGAFLAHEFVTFRRTLVQNLGTRADIIAENSVSAVLFRDREAADRTLSALRADSHVRSAGIYAAGETDLFAAFVRDGEDRLRALPAPPAERDGDHVFQEGRVVLFRPIVSEGEPIGRLFLESDLDELTRRVQSYLVIVAAVLLVSLLVSRSISARLQKTISAPILALAEATKRVSRDRDYAVRAVAETGGEIAVLVDGFNEMLSQIQSRDDALRRARDELEQRVEERTRELKQEVQERGQAERALALQAKELERSNSDLEQFAYVASHDLQEPLRMVGSYTQLLSRRYRGRLDADADEFIGYAVDGVSRMQALINDLLAYSRVGTRGKIFQSIAVDDALEEALANLKTVIDESGGSVTHDALPVVAGDRPQLVQLFQNLIGNAIKFRGEQPPHVHVSAVHENAHWSFDVTDNGIGIDPEYRDRIFVIFQRLHGRERYPGTGIGLAICKKIVERHGGRIWVESRGEGGSIFRFTIPERQRGTA